TVFRNTPSRSASEQNRGIDTCVNGPSESDSSAGVSRLPLTVSGRPTALIEKSDGQRNRRLLAFSFRVLNRPSQKRGVCAQECAHTVVPKQGVSQRLKAVV